MTTLKTAFGRGVELVNLDQQSDIPTLFILQLAHELTPSDIAYGFSEVVVFHHVLDLQTLDAYDLVLTYEVCRELVLIVSSSISNTSMNTSNLATGFVPVLAPLAFLGMSALGFCQFLLIFLKELGIAVGMPITGNHHRLQAQVKPYLLIDLGKRLDMLFYQDGDVIASRCIFGDRDGRGLASIREG